MEGDLVLCYLTNVYMKYITPHCCLTIGLKFCFRPSCYIFLLCQLCLNFLFHTLSLSPIFWISNRSSSLKGRKFLYFLSYFNWFSLNIMGEPRYNPSPSPYWRRELSYIILCFPLSAFIWFSNSRMVYALFGRRQTTLFFCLVGRGFFCLKTEDSSLPRIQRYDSIKFSYFLCGLFLLVGWKVELMLRMRYPQEDLLLTCGSRAEEGSRGLSYSSMLLQQMPGYSPSGVTLWEGGFFRFMGGYFSLIYGVLCRDPDKLLLFCIPLSLPLVMPSSLTPRCGENCWDCSNSIYYWQCFISDSQRRRLTDLSQDWQSWRMKVIIFIGERQGLQGGLITIHHQLPFFQNHHQMPFMG